MPRSRRLPAIAAGGVLALAAAVGFAGPAAASGGGGFTLQITSATGLNPTTESVTLPLLQGTHNGQAVYYVVTDDSDQADAARRGVNWAPKLAHALGTAAVQNASAPGGVVEFPGIVDFSPTRSVTPGPAGNEFGGGTYAPGAVGDATYSPLITTGGGIVFEASQIADNSGQHDSIVSIDKPNHKVTLKTFFGFWNGHRTIYLHLDASSPVVAAAEASNFAPNLDAAPGLGSNDVNTSARSAILPIVNGPVGATNPQRQGLNSALRGEGDPLNINQDIPGQGNGRYSPAWDVHPVFWTQAAIDAGQRRQLVSGSDVASAFGNGQITGGTGPANPSLGGFPAGGFISNCPIVAVG
ncbi:hypothetical protein [Pseudonocardia sp. GCM10023141]|uniref:hypothetical protein n=1 Tax=Pseudonocardia sp. GCM10023141 TaxID=3252653 RepID=UPI00361808F3